MSFAGKRSKSYDSAMSRRINRMDLQQVRHVAKHILGNRYRNRRQSEALLREHFQLPDVLLVPDRRLSLAVEKLSLTPVSADLPSTSALHRLTSPKLDTLGDSRSPSRQNRRQSLKEIGFGRLESYMKFNKLGEGTYANVYRGRSCLTGNFVALKEIHFDSSEGIPCSAIREISHLKALKHANIVTLHDIIQTEYSVTLVCELMDRDLRTYLEHCRGLLHIENIKLLLYQLLRALDFCHKRKILHRDLKPQNLLLNNNGELKLADFGLARTKSIPTKCYSKDVCTLWYRAPEVLLGCQDYSTHIDMWSVGCILGELFNGKALFKGSSAKKVMHEITYVLGFPVVETWPDFTKQRLNEEMFELFQYELFDLIGGYGEYYGSAASSNSTIDLRQTVPRLTREAKNLLENLLIYDLNKRISAEQALKSNFCRIHQHQEQLGDLDSVFSLPGVMLRPNMVRENNSRSATLSRAYNRPRPLNQQY